MNDLPNIGRILEHYGATLRRTSGAGPVKCPFHDDSHASAGVDFNKNLFNCLACGVGGNSLQIIALQERITIREAKLFADGITGQSNEQVRSKYSSGGSLPRNAGNKQGSGAFGEIRGSYGSGGRA